MASDFPPGVPPQSCFSPAPPPKPCAGVKSPPAGFSTCFKSLLIRFSRGTAEHDIDDTVATESTPVALSQYITDVREDPFTFMYSAFGHCTFGGGERGGV